MPPVQRRLLGTVIFTIIIVVVSCRRPPVPELERTEPGQAHIGELVRVFGNFLDYRSGLFFGDLFIDNSRISGDNDQLVFEVPSGLDAGPTTLFIATEEGNSNALPFRMLPSVVSVKPQMAEEGEEVVLVTNFRKTALEVYFSPGKKAINTVEDFQIRTIVPDSAISGPIEILLSDGQSIVFPDFGVNAPPIVEQIDPDAGWVGLEVSILGKYFPESLTEVTFHPGISGTITNVSFDEVRVLVPDMAESGYVTVTTPFGRDSTLFSVLPNPATLPFVNQIVPSTIAIGCSLTIRGGNFNSLPTSVTLTTFNNSITLTGSDLVITPDGDQIRLKVPDKVVSGDLFVSNSFGSSANSILSVVPMPTLEAAFPAKNALGGQVILSVTKGQYANQVFFGNQAITSINGAFEHRKFSPGDEIIATNVPLNATNPNEIIYLEVSEGCFSDSISFEIETNKTSLNAPLAGGAHTVVIPAVTSGIGYINNDWISASGKFGDESDMSFGLTSLEYCACQDSLGNILLFQAGGDCNFIPAGGAYGYLTGEEYPEFCADNPFYWTGQPVGRISGSKVELFGKFLGRIDNKNNQYGAKTIVLSPMTQGDQIEINYPNYIESLTPTSGPPGTLVTLKGRFEDGTSVRYDYWITRPPIISNNNYELQFRIPDEPDPIEIFGLFPEITTPYFDGTESNAQYFEITGPSITSLSPSSGPVGTTVTLTGDFALQSPVDNRLKLFMGTEDINFTILSPTQISFLIPPSLVGSNNIDYQTTISYWDLEDLTSNEVTFTVTP